MKAFLNDASAGVLDENYIYGLFSGIIAICIALIMYKGITVTLTDHQIRAYHIIWLSLVFLAGYHKLRKRDSLNRLILSVAFVLLVFETHDALSALSLFAQGTLRYFDIIQVVEPEIRLTIYIRDISIIGICLFTLRNDLKFTWKAIPLIALSVATWLYIAYQPNDFSFTDPENMIVDFLPYYWLLNA